MRGSASTISRLGGQETAEVAQGGKKRKERRNRTEVVLAWSWELASSEEVLGKYLLPPPSVLPMSLPAYWLVFHELWVLCGLGLLSKDTLVDTCPAIFQSARPEIGDKYQLLMYIPVQF